MNSNAEVRDYVDGQPDEWRPSLKRMRAACRKHLRGYSERFEYGMPGYARDGEIAVGFAKQARYLSLYILAKPVLDAHRAELRGLDVGKGCIRYRRPDQIDWDLVTTLLQETVASDAEIC